MRVSISKVKLFKACRRAYEFKYIHELEPVQKADSLVVGGNYHKKLEDLYTTGDFDMSDFSKESAMALAYKKYIYPKFKVECVESYESCPLGEHTLIGYVDGLSDDAKLVEHKTTSLDPEEYIYNLQWDEQILAYMGMTGTRDVYYTICKKPTIRQRKGESDEDFFWRMVDWYDTDTDRKITVELITRTDEDVEAFMKDLKSTVDDMENPVCLYKNTSYCNAWGRRCEYAPICMHYDPNEEYVGFKKREERK